jgi:hypothetical protein
MPRFQPLIALFTALCLIGCTSMRPLPKGTPAEVRRSLKVGDQVSVAAVNGKTYLLKLTEVGDEKIVGEGDNKRVTIRYEQIKTIEVRQFSKGRTAGFAGGTLVALWAGIVIVGALVAKAVADGLAETFRGRNDEQ